MACGYLNFSSHTENTSKQQKNGGFCEELLSENDFETVLVNFCSYDEYIIVAMLLRQFRDKDTSWSYVNSLNS